jgi:hypothetical protein
MRTHRLRGAWTLLAFALAGGCESRKVPEPGPAQPVPSAGAPGAPSSAPISSSSATTPAAAPAPSASAPPSGLPRFAWTAPSSVGVTEDVEQQGQRMKFVYRLDVCPGEGGGVFVSHRDVTVKEIAGAPIAGGDHAAEVRQIEAAASALPTMIVDRSGVFVRGTGYPEMIERAMAAFPGEEFAQLRTFLTSGRAPEILDVTLAQLWQTWVGVWLRYDPSHGAVQDAKDLGAGPDASRIHLSYGGAGPEHRVKLAAHRVPTRDELAKLAGVTGGVQPGASPAAVLDWDVETDWPDVRPVRAHSRRTATMNAGGTERTQSEDHTYTFDWRATAYKPQCGTSAGSVPPARR